MTDSVNNNVPETPLTANTETEASIPVPTKLQVIPNWKKVFLTWSFWFHVSSVVLTFIEQILPYFSLLEPTMTTQTYAICVFTLNGLGLLSRFIKQKKLWVYPNTYPEQDAVDRQDRNNNG